MIKHIVEGPKGGRIPWYQFEEGDFVEFDKHDRSPKGRKKFATKTYRGQVDMIGDPIQPWHVHNSYGVTYIDEDGHEQRTWVSTLNLRPQKHFRSRLVIDEISKNILEAI